MSFVPRHVSFDFKSPTQNATQGCVAFCGNQRDSVSKKKIHGLFVTEPQT